MKIQMTVGALMTLFFAFFLAQFLTCYSTMQVANAGGIVVFVSIVLLCGLSLGLFLTFDATDK